MLQSADPGVKLLTLGSNGGSADSAAYVSQETVQQLAAAAVLQDQLRQGVVILQLLQNLHPPIFHFLFFLCFGTQHSCLIQRRKDQPGI